MTINYFLLQKYNIDLIINIDGFNEAAVIFEYNYAQKTNTLYPIFWKGFNQMDTTYENTKTLNKIFKYYYYKKTVRNIISSTILNKSKSLVSHKRSLSMERYSHTRRA